jgi:general secretion pathway protein M
MIRAWWEGLPARDRVMVGVGAVVIALLLGWAWLWYPLSQARSRIESQVRHQRDDLAWMRQATAELATLHTQGARGHADRQGKSLFALADVTARGAGLATALKRVEPTGPKSVRVSFETANFDALMTWVDGLTRDFGVQATDLSADRVEGIGLVNARVTLEEP